MKKSIFYFILLMVIQNTFAIDVRKMKAWTEGLRDETIKIGVFTRPLDSRIPHILQSGMEADVEMLPLGIWNKFWPVESLRGEFDNLFLSRMYWAILDERYLVSDTFVPFAGTTWLLLLKPQLNEQGQLLPDAVYMQDELNKIPWATDKNLFSTYRRDFGALCIGWESSKDSRSISIYSTNLVTRLKEIMAAPDFPPEYDELYSLVEQALNENLLHSGYDLGNSPETEYFPE